MERLFALHNIQYVILKRKPSPIFEGFDEPYDVYFAYTKDLLEKNILIEISGVFFLYDLTLPEDLEVTIKAYSFVDNIIYEYTLFKSIEAYGPLPLSRLTADLIAFIESCNKNEILDALEEVSMYLHKYDEVEYKLSYDECVRDFTTAMNLIKEKK